MLAGPGRLMLGHMTESIETFQIPIEAAECYEAEFVPAFFAQWAPILCTAAAVTAGQTVLDVGCGTGIVARTAADLVAPAGSVTGLDLNEAMLTVARRVRPDVAWRQGDACALPFDEQTFDVVLSQMALMFVPDRTAALGEMGRVVKQGGAVGLLVPSELERQVAFAPFVDIVARHAGPEARSLMSSYFVCGSLDGLTALVETAGLTVTTAASRPASTRHRPSTSPSPTRSRARHCESASATRCTNRSVTKRGSCSPPTPPRTGP